MRKAGILLTFLCVEVTEISEEKTELKKSLTFFSWEIANCQRKMQKYKNL